MAGDRKKAPVCGARQIVVAAVSSAGTGAKAGKPHVARAVGFCVARDNFMDWMLPLLNGGCFQ